MPSPSLHEALAFLASGGVLSAEDCRAAVAEILDGSADPVQIAGFLTALRMKGESADELAGAVQAVRDRMIPLEVPAELRPILDTCGTGGDGANTVNISTAAAIVVAACGVRVAKHGNRSASGNSGSAEVLTKLGVKIDAEPAVLTRCLGEVGITFLFAPKFHPALKALAPIRKALPFRTLFNLVGPLVNPARPDAQILGVPDEARAELVASCLDLLKGNCRSPQGYREKEILDALVARLEAGDIPLSIPNLFRSFVVTGDDGIDEVTLSGATQVRKVDSWSCDAPSRWEPADFGLPIVAATDLVVTGPDDSAAKIRAMLAGERGPVRDVVLANAAAALKLVKKTDTLYEGVAMAAEAIDRGDAARLLGRWAALSHQEG